MERVNGARAINFRSMVKCAETYTPRGFRTVTVRKPLRLRLFALGAAGCALLTLFFVMDGIRVDPRIAEWWTMHIERGWEVFAGTLTSWLPMSVFEIIIGALVVTGVYLFARLVINLCFARFKRIVTGLLVICVCACSALDLYMLSMGFGYYRTTMPLAQAGADYTADETVAAAEYFLNDYNALAQSFERDANGRVVCPYTTRELAELLQQEYARLDDDYYFSYTPKVKPIVNSRIMSAFNIIGITFLPTGEANINIDAPPTQVTFTAAHELAHTKGVQREGDANLLAQYVLLSSENDYLRYCGYYNCFSDLLTAVFISGADEQYYDIRSRLAPSIAKERSADYEYWSEQPDIIGRIGEFFNNIYLIFNGADNGTGSYGDGSDFDIIRPTDPETGDPIFDPDTGKPIVIPVYSSVQKMYFYLYEENEEAGDRGNSELRIRN